MNCKFPPSTSVNGLQSTGKELYYCKPGKLKDTPKQMCGCRVWVSFPIDLELKRGFYGVREYPYKQICFVGERTFM
jgi:hypothetical protein